jgi:hypothetical protein
MRCGATSCARLFIMSIAAEPDAEQVAREAEYRELRRKLGESGVQEIQVTVKGGYSPDLIVVRRGVPVRLNFIATRPPRAVIKIAFGIARDLPAYKGEGGRVHLNLRHADDARQTYRGSE